MRIALFYILCFPVLAKATGFSNVIVLNNNQPSGDSVRIAYAYTSVTNPALFFSRDIHLTDTTISINICFGAGQQQAGVTLYDTINLGILPAGSFQANIQMYKTAIIDTLCTMSYWYDSVLVPFTVSYPTEILTEDAKKSFKLYMSAPQLLRGEFTQAFEQNTFVDIYDVSGRKMVGKPFIHTNYFEVDVSTFPAGVYLVAIQNEKISVVKRWTKQ